MLGVFEFWNFGDLKTMSLPKIIKSLIFILLFTLYSLLFTLISPSPVWADEIQTQVEFEQAVGINNDQFTAEDHTKFTTEAIIHTLNIMTAGPQTQELGKADSGAIGKVAGLIGSMYTNPPAGTGEYLADLGSSLGIVKPAYAQGTGWKALSPVLKIWKAFRNVAYMGFVVIFIVIGFMIMFRAKIDPQTVISLQSALPKLIITLLLITFSYAIAGLMIDLIYIAIYLVVGIFNLGGLIDKPKEVVDLLLSKNPFNLVYMKGEADILYEGPAHAIQEIVGGVFGNFKDTVFGVGGGIIKVIFAVAVLFQLMKLFFSLLLCYLGIVISVIFAPITILFNALPGSTSFMNWIKSLLANIAPFPAVAAMFLLAAVLIGPARNNPWHVKEGVGFYSEQKEVWAPPMLMVGEKGGAGSVAGFQALIGFGMIMIMPTVVSKIKKMLKVEPSGFGGAILGGVLGPISGAGQVVQGGWNMYQQVASLKSAKAERDWRQQMQTEVFGKGKGGKA